MIQKVGVERKEKGKKKEKDIEGKEKTEDKEIMQRQEKTE